MVLQINRNFRWNYNVKASVISITMFILLVLDVIIQKRDDANGIK